MSRLIATLLVVTGLCLIGPVVAGENDTAADRHWPRFRGPVGSGHSQFTDVPTQWSASSVAWQTDLPVTGHSSPIVWGDRVFLTGASDANGRVQRHVLCLDRRTGNVLWNQVAAQGNGETLHKMNSWATPSCATDGEHVVAFFGDGGLHCFDVDGKRQWSRDLGAFPGPWGVGASPIILDDLVIQNCDAAGDSYLLAVEKSTGKDIWKTPRRVKPRGGWSTPVLINIAGRPELLVNGEFGVQSYDPRSGEPNWFCKSFNGRGTPSPVWDHEKIFIVNGKAGDVYCVKPGGQGDVTNTHMVWHTPRKGGRDLPSPILVNEALVVISMSGIATCYDSANGQERWKSRLGGNHSASPVVCDDLIYALAEDGQVTVFRAGERLDVVARNQLDTSAGELFRSSIAVGDGHMLIRSDQRLYCIGTP